MNIKTLSLVVFVLSIFFFSLDIVAGNQSGRNSYSTSEHKLLLAQSNNSNRQYNSSSAEDVKESLTFSKLFNPGKMKRPLFTKFGFKGTGGKNYDYNLYESYTLGDIKITVYLFEDGCAEDIKTEDDDYIKYLIWFPSIENAQNFISELTEDSKWLRGDSDYGTETFVHQRYPIIVYQFLNAVMIEDDHGYNWTNLKDKIMEREKHWKELLE